ncbi:MAG: bifunctional alpha/beta hydrolase/class I SAM-dependent methyltransferase [Shewanella algae]
MDNAARVPEEHFFTTHDGFQLFYRFWPALETNEQEDPGAVLLFHRGHEHGGRMAHLVDELALPEQAFFAWDARGHGQSPGARGDSPSFGTSVRDIQTFVEHIERKHGFSQEQLCVVAQSVGAVLASTWVHDYAPSIRALVLASPAFSVKLYVPFAIPGLKLLRSLKGNFFVNSYVKAKLLTHDPARQYSFETDPLIARPISVNVLLGLYDAAERVVANAQAITVPTQVLISGADYVVRRKPQQQFFERLGSQRKELHLLPGFYHDTLGELDRADPIARIRRFLRANIASPQAAVNLLQQDKFGPSCAESESLAASLPEASWQAKYWQATRAVMKLGEKYSEGIALGFERGFDSGSTLDYVYRNTPSGKGEFGRFVDKQYLNAIGWRGIRQRKRHIEELLAQALSTLRKEEKPLHLMDVAAGHGRYLLESLANSDIKPDSVLLRDYSDINIRDGRALIDELGLSDIVRFEKGDAFDFDSLAAVEPKPTLAVVSGLYELFGDNEMVSRSLAGIAAALAPGGLLIYTGQPWHPQLEFIGRALTSHRDGQPWVMRRRSQQEMDQLTKANGFHKLTQRVDEWGIFTVSMARKAD